MNQEQKKPFIFPAIFAAAFLISAAAAATLNPSHEQKSVIFVGLIFFHGLLFVAYAASKNTKLISLIRPASACCAGAILFLVFSLL
jgi:hypothetical protein